MRQKKSLQILGICIILILFGLSFRFTSPVQANPLLQDAPQLNDYKIYFTEANSEASRFDRSIVGLSRFAGLLSELGAQLETLEWRTNFPTDADLIIIAGPLDDFTADQTARLWTYINDGGKVLLLTDPLQLDRGRNRGLRSDSGLFQLLWTDFGVRVRNDIVLTEGFPPAMLQATAESTEAVELVPQEATQEATAEATLEATATAAATPTQQAETKALSTPVVNFNATELSDEHPIMQGLKSLSFFLARSIEIDLSVREFPVEPLVFSDRKFYGENNFTEYYNSGLAIYNIDQDTQPSLLALAAAYENLDTNTRLVLVGDREFATNGSGLQSSPSSTGAFLYPDNVRFLLNSVTWLLGAEKVNINFPTPGPTATVTPVPTVSSDVLSKPNAELGITISVSNVRPIEGEIILYNINLINNGPDAATNIVITDVLPPELEYILVSGGTYNSETGEWRLQSLEASEGANLKLVVRTVRGTADLTVTNRIEILGSDANDAEPSNNVASVDVTVAKVLIEPAEGQ